MAATLDELAGDVGDQLGRSMNRLSKLVLSSFFSGMAESIGEICSELSARKKLASEKEILQMLDDSAPRKNSNKVLVEWVDSLPSSQTPADLDSHIAKKINDIDADFKAQVSGSCRQSSGQGG